MSETSAGRPAGPKREKRSRLKKKGGGTPSRKDKAPDTGNSEHAELKHRNQFGLMGTCYFIPLLREGDCAFESTTRSVLKIWFTKVALETLGRVKTRASGLKTQEPREEYSPVKIDWPSRKATREPCQGPRNFRAAIFF